METLKNLVYSGVGLVSITTEKFRELVDTLVEEKKLSSDEGRKIMDDFYKNTEDTKDDFESQLSALIEKMMKSFNFATTSDVNALAERVKELEADTQGTKSGGARKTTRSSTRKSTTTSSTAKKASTASKTTSKSKSTTAKKTDSKTEKTA